MSSFAVVVVTNFTLRIIRFFLPPGTKRKHPNGVSFTEEEKSTSRPPPRHFFRTAWKEGVATLSWMCQNLLVERIVTSATSIFGGGEEEEKMELNC